jgi:NAD+ kinase
MSNHANLAKTQVGLRQLAKKIGEAPLTWEMNPKKCMIVSKISDPSLIPMTIDIASWLMKKGLRASIQKELYQKYLKFQTVNSIEILEKANLEFWIDDISHCKNDIDFVITLGGDGTVLYAAWLFQQKAPPIIPFNLGSLGFLTVFDCNFLESTLKKTLDFEEVSNIFTRQCV